MKKINILKYFILALSALVCVTACDKEKDEPEDNNVVDLGLPSGTLWATCNVGAEKPWDYGDYFAWGETSSKSVYNWDNYKYCTGGEARPMLTKYCDDPICGDNDFCDKLYTLEPADDAATMVVGGNYSTPTEPDWVELCSQCYWIWTTDYNNTGVSGYIVYKAKCDEDKAINRGYHSYTRDEVKGIIDNLTGMVLYMNWLGFYNGDNPLSEYSLADTHIFFPASFRFNEGGYYGNYWSATNSFSPREARYMSINNGFLGPLGAHYRCDGFSVRPIRRK